MINKLMITLCLGGAILCGQAFGQDGERDLEEMVYNLSEASSMLHITQNINSVTRFMHPKMESEVNILDTGGKLRFEKWDYNELLDRMKTSMEQEGLVPSQRIPNIHYIQVKDEQGVVSYSMEYNDRIDGELVQVGRRLITLVAKNFDGQWKAVHMSAVEIVDKNSKGACDCYFFEKGSYQGGELITAKIRIPGGDEYYVLADHFEFYPEDGGDHMIKVGKLFYRWFSNGEIWELEDDGSKAGKMLTKVGKGRDKYEVMLTLMEKEFYTKNCSKVKKKN